MAALLAEPDLAGLDDFKISIALADPAVAGTAGLGLHSLAGAGDD